MSRSLASWIRVPALALIVFAVLGQASAQQPATQPAPTFTGAWRTTFGDMTLTQTGADVTGSYVSAGLTGVVTGKVEGRTLTFTYKEAVAEGEGVFDLSPDGATFTGKWRVKGTQPWGQWEGQRVDPAVAAAGATFAGVWNTSFGSMRLHQDGRKVHGTYAFAGRSTITGDIDEKGVLTFKYDQPDGEKGDGQFTLSAAGGSFSGTWTTVKDGKKGGGPWTGTRIVPKPGVIWLIVLEAPWEAQLRDNEFSYGLMLRTYFARIPRVQVRHRSISDEADVRRWCGEITYLAEPVVLYFSSHGTAEGLTVGGSKPIGADVLTECIRDAGNIKLLHFGTCLVAGGDIPKKIHEGLGKGATFPISGFSQAADWAGSALVDFAYLELIFTQEMSPADAAKQVRKMMTFAGEKPVGGTIIPPTGLVVIDPPAK
ncbi:MORN repeat-containing protein [Humisphaera borealis]|uniref:CHAT domain-containing protein n=1 Tax=Humisphaera borealis TaxID=2807512 RepID=A0A7M2WQZ3_9BACT|nr:hypothetical protein [Humisphaera borealis]QOV87843.1 hypothetical protein IPV69_16310 [Humisphaera borealis]